MIPTPLVPASLLPFLDPWGWWVAALAVGPVMLALRRPTPALRRLRGLLGRAAGMAAGMGLLLELQRRGGIGAPVRSWPGLLLWMAAGTALAHGAASLLDRRRRFRRRTRPEEPEP